MTASVARSSTNLTLPQTQNTAPVHEFRCLYTHDLRRKQKRWQDGLLKFHTFNKRVMVYDDGRNFLGDTHWKEPSQLQTDDEVMLEVGVLVQVGDVVGTSQTDLTPLFGRERKKPNEDQGLSTTARLALDGKTNAPRAFQKHRSLNALLGTPKGSYGRATLPAQSPYEARRAEAENEWEDSPNAKRRRTEGTHSAAQPWTATRATKAGKGSPLKETPLLARTVDARSRHVTKVRTAPKSNAAFGGQGSLVIKEVVDITSDNDEIEMSDVTLPSTSPVKGPSKQSTTSEKTTVKLHSVQYRKATPPRPIQSLSPPVSNKNRVRNVDTAVETNRAAPPQPSPAREPQKPAARIKTLRIAKSQTRPMLLCQQPITAVRDQGVTRRRRPDPYAELASIEDEIEGAKQPVRSARKSADTSVRGGRSSTRESRPAKGRQAAMENGENRSSSPAFGTPPAQLEHLEPPSAPQIMLDEEHVFLPKPDTAARRKSILERSSTTTKDNYLTTMDQQLLLTKSRTAKSKNISRPPSDRPFRRVQSENNIQLAHTEDNQVGALPTIDEVESRARAESSVVRKRKGAQAPKQPLRLAVSLSIEANPSKTKSAPCGKAKQTQPVAASPERETGPWTVEATDLFDWRPPDWEERVKKKKKGASET